jgi:hypothetical protein
MRSPDVVALVAIVAMVLKVDALLRWWYTPSALLHAIATDPSSFLPSLMRLLENWSQWLR